MDGQLSETNRKRKSLIYDGFTFRVDRVLTNGGISWRCTNNKSNCKARIRTDESGKTFVKAVTEHNHPSDRKKIESQQLRVQVKRCANTDISARPSKIIRRQLQNFSDNLLQPQDLKNISLAVYRERRRQFPVLPKSRQDVHVFLSETEVKTNKDENVLLVNDEQPSLYSYFRSSCSWRVRIALAHKGVDYEYRPIHLLKQEQVSDEFKKLNPMGQVPAFVTDKHTLTQSMSILEYLEEAYPEKPLLPKDLISRAKVREVCEVISSGIQPLQNLSVLQKVGDEKKVEWGHFYINKGFIALEQLLAGYAGKYSVGDEVTLADCCLVPQVYNANRFKVDMTQFPTIVRVHEALSTLEAFKAAHPSSQPDCPEDLK